MLNSHFFDGRHSVSLRNLASKILIQAPHTAPGTVVDFPARAEETGFV